MASPEQFSVKWKDFNKNIETHFAILRDDEEFSDVTLVFEEDTELLAHKVILSAGSLFFRNMLKKNKNSHPLIYMTRLKAKDLAAVVDFIYYGEAKIFQDDLNSVLAVAEGLQLRGISEPLERSPSPTLPPDLSTIENIITKDKVPDLSAGISTPAVDVNIETNDSRQISANLGNSNIDDIKAQVDMMVKKIVREN